jgi:hypothetical protein
MPSSPSTNSRDAALDKLALIVRAADCGAPQLAKEAAGLLAISKGLSLNFADDHEMLKARHGDLRRALRLVRRHTRWRSGAFGPPLARHACCC